MCVCVCVKAGSQAPFLTCESESLGQSPGICIQHPGSDPLRGAQGLEPWALLQSWAARTSQESEMRHSRDGVGGWRTASQGPSGAADQCCRQLWATAHLVRAPSGVNICPFTSELRPAKRRPGLGRGPPCPQRSLLVPHSSGAETGSKGHPRQSMEVEEQPHPRALPAPRGQPHPGEPRALVSCPDPSSALRPSQLGPILVSAPNAPPQSPTNSVD